MNRGISQEGLKLFACLTMLMDHIGAVLLPWTPLRIIGRLSFPVFCFLIAEGTFHTRNPGKYGLRLALMAVVAELPFDLCFFGGINWGHQNVMFTLLLGFCAVLASKQVYSFWLKLLSVLPFLIPAYFIEADYGVRGVMLIILFGLTREMRLRPLVQSMGMFLIFMEPYGWPLFRVLGFPVTIQLMCVLAMVPIAMYSGEKQSSSKLLQWGFYLFYPVHMAILCLLQ